MKKSSILFDVVVAGLLIGLLIAFSRSENDKLISEMDLSVRRDVKKFLEEIESLGYSAVIRESSRTFEQQQYYKKMNPKNAAPGTSSHEKGLAIDLDLYKGGTVLSKKTPRNIWLASGVPNIAKKYGMSWGGNFKNYADNNHFYF